jgi:hypothetical protein
MVAEVRIQSDIGALEPTFNNNMTPNIKQEQGFIVFGGKWRR